MANLFWTSCLLVAFAFVVNAVPSVNVYTVTPATATNPLTLITPRGCHIYPSGAVPTVTTASVLAGYEDTTQHVCCSVIGHINPAAGNDCETTVCTYPSIDSIVTTPATLSSAVIGTSGNYFTEASHSEWCMPYSACYGTYTTETKDQEYAHTTSPENFLHRGNSLSTVIAQPAHHPPIPAVPAPSYRNAWLTFSADVTVPVTGGSPYTVSAGLYSAYDIQLNQPSKATSTGTQSFAFMACKDRGVYDGSFCYIPCGPTLQDSFVSDPNTSTSGGNTYCYTNCLGHN